MTHDGHIAQPARNLPLRWRLWFTAGMLSALYALYVVLHWAHQVDNVPTGLSALAVIAVIALFLAGCIDVALTRMSKQDRATAEAHSQLAARLEECRQAINGLREAPTVNLHDVRTTLRLVAAEVQEQTLLGQVMVAEKFSALITDRLEATAYGQAHDAVERLTKQMEDLGVKVDRVERRLDTAADEANERYLADMARSVELGREIEQRRQQNPPAEAA